MIAFVTIIRVLKNTLEFVLTVDKWSMTCKYILSIITVTTITSELNIDFLQDRRESLCLKFTKKYFKVKIEILILQRSQNSDKLITQLIYFTDAQIVT